METKISNPKSTAYYRLNKTPFFSNTKKETTPFFQKIKSKPTSNKTIQKSIEIKNDSGEYENFVIDEKFKKEFREELKSEGYDSKKGIEVLEQIEKNKDQFQYDNSEQLKQEVKYRLSSVDLMNNEINQIPLFGEWGTSANQFWELVTKGSEIGFLLKKNPDTGKNLNPSNALDALIDPNNDLRVDCSTALAVLEFLTLKKELKNEEFDKLFKDQTLIIQPLKVQNYKGTKNFRDVDLTSLVEGKNKKKTLISTLDQLIPGDRGQFLNYAMQKDPYAAEYVLYMGKKNGKHYFRGHPFKTALTYKEMKEALTKEYERWLSEKYYRRERDERKMKEKYPYPTIAGDIPGLFKTIERPDLIKLSEITK